MSTVFSAAVLAIYTGELFNDMISSKKPRDVFNHGSCDLKQVAFYVIFKGNSMLMHTVFYGVISVKLIGYYIPDTML